MKKLIYSTLGVILTASVLFTSCGDGGGGTTPPTPTPTVTFKNTTGYTSQSGKLLQGTEMKFGMVISSEIELKSLTVTRNYNGAGEVIIKTMVIPSNLKTYTIDIIDTLPPALKGSFVYKFKATDKDATTGESSLTITATGPLLEISSQRVFNNKGAGFGAYDLLNSDNISTADAANAAFRDIVDQSSTSVISASWKSGNSTRFIKGGFTSQWSQIDTEDKLKSMWDSNIGTGSANVKDNVAGITDGLLILAKVDRGTAPVYILIRVVSVVDAAGADNDYIEFDYKY
ncbi:MAG: hypothetical protein V4613_13535 [Bacteroidota bacterium]